VLRSHSHKTVSESRISCYGDWEVANTAHRHGPVSVRPLTRAT